MPEIVSFIGWHNSGKTTLATRVVKSLTGKGYRVGVIKSTHKEDLCLDTPGSDTDRHRKAGAEPVMLAAPDQMTLFAKRGTLSLPALVLRYFPDVDIVIAEGFKSENHVAKIEVAVDKDHELRRQVSGVVALVTNLPLAEKHVFQPNDINAIVTFIEGRYLKQTVHQHNEAALLVNGRRIPMKSFVQDALAGTVAGFVQSLRFTEDAKEIEIKIRLKAKPGFETGPAATKCMGEDKTSGE